jgi:hypothetical protein
MDASHGAGSVTVKAKAREIVTRRCRHAPVCSIDVGQLRVAIPEGLTEAEAFIHAAIVVQNLRAALFGRGVTVLP